MTTIHDRARELSTQHRIPLSQAYAELGRRGARKRNYGRVKVAALKLPTMPEREFWWRDL